jgi:hypothetical protein
MKQLVQILMIVVVAMLTVAVVISTADSDGKVTVEYQPQQQPQREKYVAPEWVTNERGQRCIKQGTTVTCG